MAEHTAIECLEYIVPQEAAAMTYVLTMWSESAYLTLLSLSAPKSKLAYASNLHLPLHL